MPSQRQVQFHNDEEIRKRREEALQGYQIQSAQQAQQYGYQSALSTQGFQQQGQLAAQHVDLQARLHQVQLNDEEVMRQRKMERARARIEDDPTLAPYERHQLITQIESGLNPLENRQREAQMLQSHLQSQGLAQQNDQQAQLFQQRQERLQAGAEGRMRVFTNPNTGASQMFMMDLNGEWHPLDFSGSDQMHQARLDAMQTQIAGAQQQQQQSGALFGGQLERQGIDNQTARATLDYMRQIQPHNIEHAQLANRLLTEQIAQSPTRFNMEMLQGYAHTGNLFQQLDQAYQSQPSNVRLAEARARLAEVEAGTSNNPGLHERAAQANIDYQRAHTDQMRQMVMNMPNVREANDRYGAESEHMRLQNSVLTNELANMTRGGLPQQAAVSLANHATGVVEGDINHAQQELQHLIRTVAPADQITTARERLQGLQQNREQALRRHLQSAEDAYRAATGMPAANRPQAAAPPAQQNDQANAIFQGLDQQVAALPPAQRQAVAPAVARLQAIRLAFPGGFNTMPAATQREVMELIQRVRGAVPNAPAGQQGPPPSGFFQRINERFGGG